MTTTEMSSIVAAISETRGALDRAGQAMTLATNELDRRKLRIQKLQALLEDIKEIAEDNYDGPEDTHWGDVLRLCEFGLIG